MPYRLMHISDLHAGSPFNPAAAERLAEQAHAFAPDLLVISGDFVQRADFPAQWRTIKAYLKTLPQPQLLVAGNHDVPLYNVVWRLFFPYQIYRRQISADLNPVFSAPGLVVAGACSAHGLTIDGGRLAATQISALRTTFAGYGPDVCKVAVWHHPVVDAPGLHRHRTISAAPAAMRLLDEWAVELLLCGHAHLTYIGNTRDILPDLQRGTIICQSGTSTSKRGYGREKGRNAFNLISIDEYNIVIEPYLSDETGAFKPTAGYSFPRKGTC